MDKRLANKPRQSGPANRPSILLRDYMQGIEPTDRLPFDDLQTVLMGLFGEVGGVMAATKKFRREQQAYPDYQHAVEEEFGDALWYFTALCRRLGIGVDEILSSAALGEGYEKVVVASDLLDGPISHVVAASGVQPLNETLMALGDATAALLQIREDNAATRALLQGFAHRYLHAIQVAGVPFSHVVHKNLDKVRGRFLPADPASLPDFDGHFLDEERIPQRFEITITQRKSGQSYLQWNGVFVGDPLTDNIRDADGYRFHDVFHFAHAAILHWSPTFRALIKQKRKSDRRVDEAQDGGRAIVVEEGLTAFIFSRAKELNFFEGQRSVSFDILKSVEQFVKGYEVEACPLSLWERAILDGYAVFRQVRANNGGVVICDRGTRTIAYRPLGETGQS